MWDFIKKHSYDAVKMLVTQVSISIFGLVLSLTCLNAKNEPLLFACSAGAVLFYLFLIYTSVWDMGAKDSIPLQYERISYQPRKGLYISLIAHSLTWLLALFIVLGSFFPEGAFVYIMGNFCKTITLFILQGMFSGLLTLEVAGVALNELAWIYLLLPLPTLATAWLGYLAGLKNIKIFGKKS